MQYMDEYRFEPRAFAVIFVKIRAVYRLLRHYGETAGDELLRTIAEEIRHTLGQSAAAGRYARDQFLVFYQYSSPETVKELKQRLRQAVESIHHFGQRSCTLFVDLHTIYPQDEADFYPNILKAVLGRRQRKS